MAAQVQSNIVPTDAELLQAQADLWNHSLSYLTSMALKCAVELGIPTATHRLGGAASVPDLITGLSLPSAKLPFLRRLMRLLATSGVFAVDNSTQEEMYRINAVSYLLVEGVTDDRHINHTSYVRTAASARYVDAALGLAEWFKKNIPTSPFEDRHGAKLFHESMKNHDPDYHKIANEALAAHDNFGVDSGLREFRDTFQEIKSMTYICANEEDDTAARAIVKAFPHIKCTVLAKPKVVGTIPQADAVINYVAGDMLKFIPPSQVVVLKLVLHHWGDEDCVKILANCKKAIPSREDGGKVLFGDIVVDYSSPGPMLETHLLMDVAMMTMTQGRERDENEWREIFMKAGFRDYKLLKKFGARGVFEVYP